MISETKPDSSFHEAQFYMESYSQPFRLYVREEISSKLIQLVSRKPDTEYFLVEINLRRSNWLIFYNYNHYKTLVRDCSECISKEIDSLSIKYDNILLLRNFNSEPTKEAMAMFCQMHNLKSLIIEFTCYKNTNKTSCIDLIMTNRLKNFENSCTFETGQSDFHKMTLNVLKSSFKKQKDRVLNYPNYDFYNNKFFREQFLPKLNNNLSKQNNSFEKFQKTCLTVLHLVTPVKHKFRTANQTPFMNKKLNRAIKIRSKLRNKFLNRRSLTDENVYNKQINTRLKKRQLYSNLNVNNAVDGKKFWKTIKTFFSDKSSNSEKISSIEKDRVIFDDSKIAEIFNQYFSNTVQDLGL